MKQIKIFIALFSIILVGVLVYSCTKEIVADQKDEVKDNLALTSRSLGNFSVVNGRLSFPTMEDFSQTNEYLANASESEILAFRQSITLETSAKVFDEFMTLLSAMDSTSTGLPALEDAYAGKIRISTDSNGDKVYEPKFMFNNEILNLNGELAISTALYKFFDTKMVSITDPTTVNINQITENTQTNWNLGIFASNYSLMANPPCPCNFSNKSQKMYDPEKKRKRITIAYDHYVNQYYKQVPNPKGGYLYKVWVDMIFDYSTLHELHRHILFHWWWEKYKVTQLKQEFNISVTHNLSISGIPDPLYWAETNTENNTALIARQKKFQGIYYVEKESDIITPAGCVFNVKHKGTRVSNGEFCEYKCPN